MANTEDLQSYRILSLLPNRLSQDVISWRSYDEKTLLKNAIEVGLLPTILPKVLSYMIDTRSSKTNSDRYDYYSIEENEMNSKARKIQIKIKRNFLKSVLIASFMNFFNNSNNRSNGSSSSLNSKSCLQLERLALGSKTISDSISHKFNRKLSDELSKLNQINSNSSSSRTYSQDDANLSCKSKSTSKSTSDSHSNVIDSSHVQSHRTKIPRDWSADYNDIEFEMIQVMESSKASKEERHNNNGYNSINCSVNNEISENNNIINYRSPGKMDIDASGQNLSNRSYDGYGNGNSDSDLRSNKINNERTTVYQNQNQSNSKKSDLNLLPLAEMERHDVGELADRSSKSNNLELVKSISSKSLNKSPSREFLSNVSTFIATSAIGTFMLSSSSSPQPPSPPSLLSSSRSNETALYTDIASNSNNENCSNINSNRNSSRDGGPTILERYGINESENSNWTYMRKISLFVIYLCFLGSIFFYRPSLMYSLVTIIASIAVSLFFGYQLFYYDLFYYRQGYMPI